MSGWLDECRRLAVEHDNADALAEVEQTTQLVETLAERVAVLGHCLLEERRS